MRVMVTGAAGFVGRATLADLRRRGHEVDAVVRPGRAVPAAVLDPSVHSFRWDGRKARQVLGWEPPIPRELALDRTFGVPHA